MAALTSFLMPDEAAAQLVGAIFHQRVMMHIRISDDPIARTLDAFVVQNQKDRGRRSPDDRHPRCQRAPSQQSPRRLGLKRPPRERNEVAAGDARREFVTRRRGTEPSSWHA